MNRYCLYFIFILSHFSIVAQTQIFTDKLVVGKSMPDFILHNILYYPKKQASLKDFQGKWLLLEFWDKGCGACISGFPSLNGIQQQLGDSLQVMLVGNPDKERNIQPVYQRLRDKEKLVLPCAFDSVIFNRFVKGGVPNTILIDDKGVVRCWTINLYLNEVKVIMKGESLNLKAPGDDIKYRSQRIPYNSTMPLLVNDNGLKANDFLYRSVLSKWDRNVHNASQVSQIDSNLAARGKLEILGVSVEQLYKLAYWGVDWRILPDDTIRYGKIYNKLVLHLHDSSLFEGIKSLRYNINLFCYSLILPKERANTESIQQAMREDLKRYFEYEVSIEQRKCPCWKLIVNKNVADKLKKSRKITKDVALAKGSFWGNDIPFESVVSYIRDLLNDYMEDDTGIKGNVSFLMDVTFDIESTKKALRENGFDLVRSEKVMEVITINEHKFKKE